MSYRKGPQGKSHGTAFINVSKDASPEAKSALKKIKAAMLKHKVYLSLSIRNEEGGFTKYFASMNTFEESKHDMYIKKPDQQGSSSYKSKPKAKKADLDDDLEDGDDDDDIL